MVAISRLAQGPVASALEARPGPAAAHSSSGAARSCRRASRPPRRPLSLDIAPLRSPRMPHRRNAAGRRQSNLQSAIGELDLTDRSALCCGNGGTGATRRTRARPAHAGDHGHATWSAIRAQMEADEVGTIGRVTAVRAEVIEPAAGAASRAAGQADRRRHAVRVRQRRRRGACAAAIQRAVADRSAGPATAEPIGAAHRGQSRRRRAAGGRRLRRRRQRRGTAGAAVRCRAA